MEFGSMAVPHDTLEKLFGEKLTEKQICLWSEIKYCAGKNECTITASSGKYIYHILYILVMNIIYNIGFLIYNL